MTSQSPTAPILAGIASGMLFLLPVFSGGEVISLFAILPLLYIGLGLNVSSLIGASLTAIIVVTLGAADAVANFTLVDAFPALIFSRLALQHRGEGAQRQWMPIGLVMTELTAYATLVMAAIFLLQQMQGPPLTEILRASMEPMQTNANSQTALLLKQLVENTPFLLLAITAWFLLLIVYGNAWLANSLLKNNNKSIRPRLELGEFIPPGWLLAAVALMALGATITGPATQMAAKTLLLMLFFPYFLFGLSLLHRATASWPSRNLMRGMLYLLIFFTFWPAFVIAVYGLWKQAAHLTKKGMIR